MKKIIIATRGSKLAFWQANYIKDQLQKMYSYLEVDLMVIKTKGDHILDVPLSKVGGKGLFVKEIEEALLSGEADCAVHSMKDVPMQLPFELCLAAITEREDPTDMFLSVKYSGLESLPENALVGTSSLRRQAQLLALRPDLQIVPLRGNIDTRLRKLMAEEFDAIIMATAGIKRLGLIAPYMSQLPCSVMLPAVGQGALGIEIQKERQDVLELFSFLNHKETYHCIKVERDFLAGLDGGCQVPIAGYATICNQDTICLEGLVAKNDGSVIIRNRLEGSISDAYDIGMTLSKILLAEGADDILASMHTIL